MEAWMIITLIFGGIAAIGVNVWYFKSTKKKPVSTGDDEQTKRIIKQWKDRDELR